MWAIGTTGYLDEIQGTSILHSLNTESFKVGFFNRKRHASISSPAPHNPDMVTDQSL